MGKLSIKFKGGLVDEVALKLGDMTIGRSSACDIVLRDDKSVSAKHAMIKTVGKKSTIVDLDSTNGTFVGDDRIEQYELKHGDTIIIGEHAMRYRDDLMLDAPSHSRRRETSSSSSVTSQEDTKIISAHAQLIALDGKDKGKCIPLMKEETVIDNPGKNPATIYRTAYGYMLTAKVGPGEPRLNDKPVPLSGQLLENGDIVYIAATKYQVSM